MIPNAAPPPPPKPAQQIVVQTNADANSQPATVPNGSGGRRFSGNRHERRHQMSLIRREMRKRWRARGRVELSQIIARHEARLTLTREIASIRSRAAVLGVGQPAF